MVDRDVCTGGQASPFESRVPIMTGQEEKELEATYGPAAPFSEHKRGDHITYTSVGGLQSSGTIIWVQARFENIPIKYVVAPDVPTGFVDFVVPGDVIAVTQEAQEPALVRCVWCGQFHQADQVKHCPLNPNKQQ